MSTEETETPVAKEEKKEVPTEENTIIINVRDGEGSNTSFKVRKNTKMRKIFKAYSQKLGKDITNIRFMFDGNPVGDDETPLSLGMEEDDQIDAELEQVGGF
ncbi:hypothetical protein WA158_004657 [Blastocystis sp. Blastoise]